MRPQFERPLSFWAGLVRILDWLAVLYLTWCVIERVWLFFDNVGLAARRAGERRRRAERRAEQLARGLTEEEIEDEDWDAYYMEETTDLVPLEPEEAARLQELAEHEVRPGFLVGVVLFLSLLFFAACVAILTGPDFK